MKCCTCGKIVEPENALHCSFCGDVYCEQCGLSVGICSCYGDLHRYM